MKVSNTPGLSPPATVRRLSRSDRVRSGTSSANTNIGTTNPYGPSYTVDDPIQILGIPQEEFTPRVQTAISQLMGEVDLLRHDLEKAQRRIRELEELADLDSLLPIPNRRAFVRELNRMISFAERYGTPSSLIYMDMNGLKGLNDTYGHEIGDSALRHIARTLKDNLRGTDMIARLGGDEFGIILAHTDEASSKIKAEALASLLKAAPFQIDGEAPISLTYAYGIYTFRGDDNAEAALDMADKAMYVQKRAFKDER